MRCQKLISYTALAAGVTLTASAAFALPTDLGRSADVYANAVRVNTAASRFVDRKVFVPQVQEQVVAAEAVPSEDVAMQIDTSIVFDASLSVSLRGVVPVSALAAAAPPAPAYLAPAIVASMPVLPIIADEQPPAPTFASVVAPELGAPGLDEGIAVAAALSEQSNVRLRYDEAFGVPLVAVALDTLDVPPVQSYGIDEIIPASVTWTEELPQGAVASSRRPVAATNPERLLSAMADADENLVIRDGGEDGPDTMMMSSDVLFSFGAATLSEEAMETLASIGGMSDNVPVIEVLGHTDAIGSDDDNLTLGQERAEAVRAWLLENSEFTEDRVIATGVGEVDPVADNVTSAGLDNAEGRAQNRRVEFAFLTASGEVEDVDLDAIFE